MSARTTERLGELLLRRSLITQAQLEQALARQRTSGAFLGELLVDMGFATEDEVLAALAEQFGLRRERGVLARVDWSVARQFPASTLARRECFPVWGDETSVTVAIANPLAVQALRDVERTARFRAVRPVLVSSVELRELFEGYQQRALQSLDDRLTDGHDEDR
jgi:hypothetical protein